MRQCLIAMNKKSLADSFYFDDTVSAECIPKEFPKFCFNLSHRLSAHFLNMRIDILCIGGF